MLLFLNNEKKTDDVFEGKGPGGPSIQESSGAGDVCREHTVVPPLPPAGDFR